MKSIKELMKEAKDEVTNKETKKTLQEFINGFDDFEEYLQQKNMKPKGGN